jgi:hypothetical protein
MILETVLSGLAGGLLRLAPEVLRWLDRRGEREHELKRMQQEMEFAKLKADAEMHQSNNQLSVAELNAMSTAFAEQAETAKAAGKLVAALSALVRPVITYYFAAFYGLVKLAIYTMSVSQGAEWNLAATQLWGQEDMTLFVMILSFWFVGRVYERHNR